ncbi:MAG: hypothetical protein CMJ76_14115 [Planctomycetaceae bacterium]|nr:hypothetical protein [Planctomycetaceae bacterium]|tara:strand:+ start:2287 stop:3318 length:1032 start_codon:yes stop_codon:yes gene_type:complete
MTFPAAKTDPKASHLSKTLKYAKPLVSCRFDPTGRYLFGASQDFSVVRWTLADDSLKVYKAHNSWVRGLEFSKDGKTIVSGGYDDRLFFWNVEDEREEPQPIREVVAHKGWIRAIAVSPDGKILASGGNDRIVKLWEMETGKLVTELVGHERDIYSLLWHPSDGTLFSGDLTGQIKRWNVAESQEVMNYDGAALHTYNGGQQVSYGGIRGMAMSPDNKILFACGLHKGTNPLGAVQTPLIISFDSETKEAGKSWSIDGLQAIAWQLYQHEDGYLVVGVGGSAGAHLVFINPTEDKDFHRLKVGDVARELAIHPDGIQVALASSNGHAQICRLEAKPPAAEAAK